MPEEIKAPEPMPELKAPAPAAVPEPAKPAPAPVDEHKARASAEYYARHPEELDLTLQHLEAAGHIKVNQRIDQLERELAVTKAISANGLTDEDIPFIAGRTKDEIAASAAKLRARYDTVRGSAPGASEPQKTVIKAGTMGMQPSNNQPSTNAPPPKISETVRGSFGVPSVDAAKEALFKDLEHISFES